MTRFRNRLDGVVPLSRSPGDLPPARFAHSLPLSPARVGFNLDVAVNQPPPATEYAHASRLRRFRGRIVADLGDDSVHVRLGEIPSGRSGDVILPRTWFPQGMPVRVHRPFLLITWAGEGGEERQQVEDEGASEETEDAVGSQR